MERIKEILKTIWNWLGADGVEHLAVSAVIVALFGAFCPIWVALLMGLVIGLLKELLDLSRAGDIKAFNWRHCLHDLLCDLIGCAVGLFIAGLYLLIWAK